MIVIIVAKASQLEMRQFQRALVNAEQEGLAEAKSKVLEMVGKLSSWRRASRQGYVLMVTAPMAKVVSSYAGEVIADTFEATTDKSHAQLLADVDTGLAFFKEVLEKGCLPERSPSWEEAFKKLAAQQDKLSSFISVDSLDGQVDKALVDWQAEPPVEQLATLASTLATAIATTSPDDLKKLHETASKLAKKVMVHTLDSCDFFDASSIDASEELFIGLLRQLGSFMQDNAVVVLLDEVLVTAQRIRGDVVKHWTQPAADRVSHDEGSGILSMMYAFKKICDEFKGAAKSGEFGDTGKFATRAEEINLTIKEDVEAVTQSNFSGIQKVLDAPFNASSPTQIFRMFLGGADSQDFTTLFR